MRIHSDTLTEGNICAAAIIARADIEVLKQTGSKSRDHAFTVHLTGESRRMPNRDSGGEHAATWDQWGVFLSVLFDHDNGRTFEPSAPMTCSAYKDRAEFDRRTDGRFIKGGPTGYWPPDAHGDHTFRFAGTPGEQSCTKCSAVQRWAV